MGKQIIPLSLERRLKGSGQKDGLRSNPSDRPFWIPEENPLLQAWNMTLNEYCQAVQRTTGLQMRHACHQTFSEIWSDLDEMDWNVNLIFLLGNAYRLLHQDGRQSDAGGGYTPDPDPPQVWVRWEAGPMETRGTLVDRNELASALVCLLLMPFAQMEERKNNERGKIPGKDGNL